MIQKYEALEIYDKQYALLIENKGETDSTTSHNIGKTKK